MAVEKDPLHSICILPRQRKIFPHGAFVSALPASFYLGNWGLGGLGGQYCEEGRRGAERGRLPLPYLTRHVALLVAAAGCNDEDEDDEPRLSKRILKEGGSKGKTHTHCVLPHRENPPSREKVQGSHYPPRLHQLAPGSGIGPRAPAHLSIRSGWLGEGRGVSGWVGGKRRRAGQKRGCTEGSAPEALRKRSGRYRRQGAATWRSERRRRGFTTTVVPVAAAAAASVASATA